MNKPIVTFTEWELVEKAYIDGQMTDSELIEYCNTHTGADKHLQDLFTAIINYLEEVCDTGSEISESAQN